MATMPPGSWIGSFPYEVVWTLDAEPNRQIQVYLAKIVASEASPASYVVVKLACGQSTASPPPVLAQEVEQLCQLKHPGIVRIFPIQTKPTAQPTYLAQAIDLTQAPWFSVREYLAGGSLAELLANKELDLSTALEIGREVATTLDYIHSRQQLHRCLNPQHVLFRAHPVQGKPVQPVLIGFGHHAQPAHNLVYSAPEALALQSEAGAINTAHSAQDIYALGIMLYEMLTGQLPFPASSLPHLSTSELPALRLPSSHNRQINQPLDTLLVQMMSRSAQERPSAAEVATRLELIAIAGGYLRHYPSGVNDTTQSLFARRRIGQQRLRWAVIILSVLVVLLLLWLLGIYYSGN